MLFDVGSLLSFANTSYRPKQLCENEIGDREIRRVIKKMSEEGYVFQEKTIEALVAYLKGYGVLLSGAVGIGKTLFFRRVNPSIIVLDMNVVVGWKQDELMQYCFAYRDQDMLIDDLGCGGSKGFDFKREYDVLLTLLNEREKSKIKGFRTHFTTNLTNEELVKGFDPRCVDRIYGFAKCFRLADVPSLREAEPITA